VADDAAFAARATVRRSGADSVQAPKVTAADFRCPGGARGAGDRHLARQDPDRAPARGRIPSVDGDRGPTRRATWRDRGDRAARKERQHRHRLRAGLRAEARRHRLDRLPRPPQHRVVGVDYADMALAANRLGEIEGGFVVVEGGKVQAELALPVAGLMSLEPFEDGARPLVDLRAAARALGVELEEPFLQLAFLACR
jgi:adenine deaminase